MAKHTKNVLEITLMFFFLSFVGWLWEVSIHIVEDGRVVNRGVLHGPWLPVYGMGAVLIIILFWNRRDRNPFVQMMLMMAVCGIVEYGASEYLEWMYDGRRWWDYTGYFLNIQGRICLLSLMLFAIGGMIIVHVILPVADRVVERFEPKALAAVLAVLVFIFVLDGVYSVGHPNTGTGINDYRISQCKENNIFLQTKK